MATAIYLSLVFATAFLIAYTMKWQGATLYWGKALAADNPMLPSGMQDAITPPIQSARNILTFVAPLALLIGGFFLFRWYLAIGIVVLMWFASGFIGFALPKRHSRFFRDRIRKSMQRRLAAYAASGDQMRCLAMQHTISKFDSLAESQDNAA